jgi:hypothetical protein
MSGTTKPDWKQPALDYYREILLNKNIKKPPYFSTTERSFLAFFLLTKVKLQSAEPTDKNRKTAVCESQSERKLFNIKLGNKSAKEFYTLIKFYENRLHEAFSQSFHQIIRKVFDDLKKLCGYDDNKTDFVNETDAHRISKIMNKIGSVLEIDYNIENQVADEIRKKDFGTEENKTKENLLGKFVAPAPVATSAALGSGDFTALLKNIRTKFPDINEDRRCEKLFTGIDVAKYESLFNLCTNDLQKYFDALKKDDPSLKDDLTMTNYYERLNKLNDEHTEHVNKEIASVNTTFASYKLNFSDVNTFAKIKAEVEKIGLKELYKDLYEKIATNGITETNILEKLDKKNYNFAQKMGFFTVGAVGATAGLAVGAVGATGYVVSMPFIKLYETLKNRKSGETSGFTPVVPDGTGVTSAAISAVTQDNELQKFLDSKFKKNGKIDDFKTLFKNLNDDGFLNTIESEIGKVDSKLNEIINELNKVNHELFDVLSAIYTINYSQYKILPTLKNTIEIIDAIKLEIKRFPKVYSGNLTPNLKIIKDVEPIKNKVKQKKAEIIKGYSDWKNYCKAVNALLLAGDKERSTMSKALYSCKNYLDENASDAHIFNDYDTFQKCVKDNYFVDRTFDPSKTVAENLVVLYPSVNLISFVPQEDNKKKEEDVKKYESAVKFQSLARGYLARKRAPQQGVELSQINLVVPQPDQNPNATSVPDSNQNLIVAPDLNQNPIVANAPDPNQNLNATVPDPNQNLNATVPDPNQNLIVANAPDPNQNLIVANAPDPNQNLIVANAPDPNQNATPAIVANRNKPKRKGNKNKKIEHSNSTPNLLVGTTSVNIQQKAPEQQVATLLSNQPDQGQPQSQTQANVPTSTNPQNSAAPDLNASSTPMASENATPAAEIGLLPQPPAQGQNTPPHPPVTIAEEAHRQAAEAAENQKLAEEAAEEAAEAQRQAAEAAEAKRLADEAAKAAEAQRLADEAAAEAKRLADEAAKAAEAQRLADKAAEAKKQTNATKIQAKTRQYFTKKQIKQMLRNLENDLGLQGTFQQISSKLNSILEKIRNLLKTQSLPKPGNTLSSLTTFVEKKEHEKYLQALGYKDSQGVLKIYHKLVVAMGNYEFSAKKIQRNVKEYSVKKKQHDEEETKNKKILTEAKDSFALVNEPYPEALSAFFPELNKNKIFVNYWKEMSNPNPTDENIFKYYLPEFINFKKYVLQTVYGINDETLLIELPNRFKNFTMLCAVIEKNILLFDDLTVFNAFNKYYSDNLKGCKANKIQKISESDLSKVNTVLYEYFGNILSLCFQNDEITLVNSIINSQENREDTAIYGIILKSYKHIMFSYGTKIYKKISGWTGTSYTPYTYTDFLNEIAGNDDGGYNVDSALNRISFENLASGEEKYDIYEPGYRKDNVNNLLTTLARRFANQKTSGGRSLTRKIIKKSNPNKNAQTKKNKGRRDQLRKGGQTRRRSSAISSSSSRTRRKRIRRQ